MSSRVKSDAVKKGERVKARWSGSNVFYDSKVVEVFSKSARVQFDDGSISTVKIADIKKISTKAEKSPSPKEIKIKSRSRSRSTGRPRSRSRSPARAEKKGAEKKEKKPTRAEKKKSESSNANSVANDEIDSVPLTPLTREKIGLPQHESTTIKSTTTVNSFSRETNVGFDKRESSSGSERIRSARLAALRSAEATQRLFDSKDKESRKTKDKAKYSDDEEEEEDEVVPTPSISRSLQALYFIITWFRMILLPVSLLFLAFACTKKQCSILDVPQFYSRWRDFVNSVKIPLGCVVSFHLLQCILSLIPLGYKVTGFSLEGSKKPVEYCLNGLMCLIFNVMTFGICVYVGVYTNWGYDKFRPIALSCALYCIFFSIILHIYALLKKGEEASSKIPFLGRFYNGSYRNPFIFKKIDVKTSFIRAGFIGCVILNLSIVLKYFLMKGSVSIPLGLTVGMQEFFILDLFIREEKLLSTATYTTDTIGYSFFLTTGFIVPIGMTMLTTYLFNYDSKANLLPHWCAASMVALFFLGYYIYMTSSNLKHNFRRNPFAPSLSGVESIPTSRKKRLIASGLWGLVRHPNYLGLLIMATAWTLPCGFTHTVPYGPLVMLFFGLLVRIFSIERECKEKYGPAWKNYTERVRSRIIPYIF